MACREAPQRPSGFARRGLTRRLTIVGGGRDAWSVWGRGTQERLWARGPCQTWSSGPSTSPLADMALASVKRLSLVGAVGTSVLVASYAVWLFSHSRAPNYELIRVHHLVVATLFATWHVADANDLRRAPASLDHGWFVLLLFPFYTAYYLISTRRWRRGGLIAAAITVLFALPWLVQLVAWYVS